MLRPNHTTNYEDGIVREGIADGEGEGEDEMDEVIRLAVTYLRVAALGLPAFGGVEVMKYAYPLILFGRSIADREY